MITIDGPDTEPATNSAYLPNVSLRRPTQRPGDDADQRR